MAAQAGDFGRDLHGRRVERLAQPDTRLVVLFFAASDCPVSNRYIPEITRLRGQFGPRHVAFWWVFPNPGDTQGVVREHERQFSMEGDTLLDTRQNLVRMARVTTTPEAAVFSVTNGDLHEVYRGRVDDRYISFGTERPQANQHDLEEAISAALDGRAVSRSITRPVGCAIVPLPAAR
jgi:hypothetical protein